MLHFRIHDFLCFSFERAAMKTQHFANIWKTALVPIAHSNYAPVVLALLLSKHNYVILF